MNQNWLKIGILFFALAIRMQAQSIQSLVFSNDTASVFPTVSLNAIAFGGSNFVAVGTNSTIWTTRLTNTTGITGWLNLAANWHKATPGSTLGFEAATYGKGVFVVGGSSDLVFISTNGIGWTGVGNAFSDGLDIKGLAFVGANYVAASQGLDITLTNRLGPSQSTGWPEASINNQVIFEGYRGAATSGANKALICGVGGVIRTSSDSGNSWSISGGNSYDGSQATLLGAASDGANNLVCVGAAGTIKHSANGGTSWTTSTVGGNNLNAVAWTGLGFIAVGNGGTILTSQTGASWQSVHSPTALNLTGVAFGTNGPFQNVALLVDASGQVVIGGILPAASVTNGTAVICNGGSTNISVNISGSQGPWTVTLSDGTDSYTMNTSSSNVVFTVTPTNASLNAAETFTYQIKSVIDDVTGFSAPAANLTGTVVVTNNPRPTATVGGSQAICNGGSAMIPVALTGIGPWTFTLSDGFDSYTTNTSSANVTFAVTPTNGFANAASNFTYTVMDLSDGTLCTADPADLIGTFVVTNYPRPTAVVSGNATICNGGTAIISAALTGIGPWTVYWSDGAVSNNVAVSPATHPVSPADPNLNTAVTNTYAVTNLTDAHCTAEAIDLSGSAAITVNPRPTAVVSGTQAICNGGTAIISAALTGIGPWNVYWSDGAVSNNVAVSPATHPVSPADPNLNTAVTNTYTVTNLTDANCTAESIDLSGNAAITVNPRPTAVVSGTQAICNGGTAILSAALTGIGPWNVYWSDGAVSNNVAVSPATHPVNPADPNLNTAVTNTYTVTNLTDAHCTAEPLDLSGSAAITVNPRPTAVVSGTQAICNGGTAIISAALTGIGPWNVYWSDGAVSNNVVVSPATHPVSPADPNLNTAVTNTYTVTNLTDAHCTAEALDLTGSAAITVNPRPTALVSGTQAICNGGTAIISAALTGIGPWNVYWSDGAVSNNVAVSPATHPVSPADPNLNTAVTNTYTVTNLTDAHCTAEALDLTGSAAITVNPRPTAVVSGSVAICNGGSAIVSVALTGFGPWTVTLSSNGVALPPVVVGSSNPGLFTTNFTVSPTNTSHSLVAISTYAVTNLSDAHCTAEPTDLTGSAAITVNPLPVPTSLGDQTNCAYVANPPLVVSVLTNAAFPAGSITVDWYDLGTNGTLVASSTNSFVPTNNAPGSYTYWAQASATNTDCGCVCVNTNRTPVTLLLQNCLTNSGWPTIQIVGTNVVVMWLGNVDLQETNALTAVTNGWTNVATGVVGVTNSFTNSPSDTNGFFRLAP